MVGLKELDEELNELNKYSAKSELEKLNKKIYNLDFDEDYLNSLSQDDLQYIHVKLHTSLSYKQPFAELDKIKKAHNLIVPLLNKHTNIDDLDNNSQKA